MTITFKMIVLFIFFAHTVLSAFIIFKLNDTGSVLGNLLGAALWTLYIMIIGTMILFTTIEDKGLHYGKTLYSVPLYPFKSDCGDSVYLETNCNTCRFQLSEDSTIWTNKGWCSTLILEEEKTPYCEYVSIVAEPWVSEILKPEHRLLQPRYILHVPSGGEYEIPCEETSDGWEAPPY